MMFLPVVGSIEVGSELGTMFAYGSAMDPLGIRFYISGTDATPSFGETSTDATKCYLAVGRAGVGLERKLLASPSMCLDMLVFPYEAGTSTAEAKGLIVAMDAQNQPQLYHWKYSNYQMSLPDEPFALPANHFPALIVPSSSSTTEEPQCIYVALHPTLGIQNRINPNNNDNSNNNNRINLVSTHDYLMHLSHPRFTSLDQAGDVGYSPTILKYNTQTRQPEWNLTIHTINGKTMIAGMVEVDNDRLVIFGSSTGNVFVDGSQAITGPGPNTVGDRWDGFVVWVNAQTGQVDLSDYTSPTHNNLGGSIRSQLAADDFVLGACFEDDKAYVVGYTTGKFEGNQAGGAFVVKMDTQGRDHTWSRQFVGQGLEFTHCVVRGDTVVVGGNAESSEKQAPRNGNDAYTGPATQDLVLVELDKRTGETSYIRQLDSHRNDQLVKLELRGGAGSQKDTVYVTANAWDWEAQPTPSNDLFIITMDSTGDHQWLNIEPELDPITMLKDGTYASDNEGEGNPNNPSTNGIDKNDDQNNSFKTTAIVLPIVLVVLVAVFSFLILWSGRQRNKNHSQPTLEAMTSNDGINEHPGGKDLVFEEDTNDVESVASENKII